MASEKAIQPIQIQQQARATATKPTGSRGRKRIGHENKALLFALASGSAALIVAFTLLWSGDYSHEIQWTLSILVLLVWFGFAFSVRSVVMRPLQTLSNVLAALREEDFSIRARSERSDDALGEVAFEINQLSKMLREQRLGAIEASALLERVIAEIDVAIFTFDSDQRLRLVNRAGERLLASTAERILGNTATELGLATCLAGASARTLDTAFPGATGRWGIRRTSFRQSGTTHQLIVIADLSRALREEERQAWQRLVRVLGHELNNSLTPVRSIAESLEMLLKRDPRPEDWEQDVRGGLRIILERSEALTRFMHDYARLSRLPQPNLRLIELEPIVRRVAGLETRRPIKMVPGPPVRVSADPDQIEQLLINLVRNAVDAVQETQGEVVMSWAVLGDSVEIVVEDEGPGISNSTNLFVPFFTTKSGGTGIGLALSRQIAEAHGGNLTLENRRSHDGCTARFTLPLRQNILSSCD
jgi:nitrogen fixation/metabolism regulation signal transduction histidine kinase